MGAFRAEVGARHDLINHLEVGERLIADRGYDDWGLLFVTQNSHAHLSEQISLILARHETVNGRLKKFNVLKLKYRHSIESHFACFYVIATVVQLNLQFEPLFHLNLN